MLPGMRGAGYVEGENITIEYRGRTMKIDRLPALASDLVPQTWCRGFMMHEAGARLVTRPPNRRPPSINTGAN